MLVNLSECPVHGTVHGCTAFDVALAKNHVRNFPGGDKRFLFVRKRAQAVSRSESRWDSEVHPTTASVTVVGRLTFSNNQNVHVRNCRLQTLNQQLVSGLWTPPEFVRVIPHRQFLYSHLVVAVRIV